MADANTRWHESRTIPLAANVYVAPGNAGTAQEPNLTNVDISATDIDGWWPLPAPIISGLTIVGPEAPLVMGVVDAFNAAGLTIFGPPKVPRSWKAQSIHQRFSGASPYPDGGLSELY